MKFPIEKALKCIILCHKTKTKYNSSYKNLTRTSYDIDEELML